MRDRAAGPLLWRRSQQGELLWPERLVSHSLLIVVQAKLLPPLKFWSLEVKKERGLELCTEDQNDSDSAVLEDGLVQHEQEENFSICNRDLWREGLTLQGLWALCLCCLMAWL